MKLQQSRWWSPANDLVLCEEHAEPIWTRLKNKDDWDEVLSFEAQTYSDLTGHEFPCDWCHLLRNKKERNQ